jgi:signal peptidase II
VKVMSFFPYAGLAAVAIALDQWIKALVEARLVLEEPVHLTPFLALYRTYNTGIAFSMFSSFGDGFLVLMSLVVIGFVLWLAGGTRPEQVLARAGFALVVGGAVGNLIDRVAYGHVIDYILFHTPLFTFAVFNLADAAISVGACLVVAEEFLAWRRRAAGGPPPG